ncbi:Hypothetical protein A7982_04589 [Minicystis rosea]|nr:Hypothetical protein A7982_04589 [Minicystis rosea]
MNELRARADIQVFRIATLVVPSALAWEIAFSSARPSRLATAVTFGLGPMWLLMAGALVVRSVDALLRRRRADAGATGLLDHIDVLTASGSALMWLSAGAIAAAVWVGWASLSVVGMMGLAIVHLVVLWTWLRAGGRGPWRRASVSRRFVPERVDEGAPVMEEVRLADVDIPTGFRLFVSGRVGARWAMSRHAVEDTESGGEILLETEIGPALRGEHDAEPLALWFQDVLGLCRSPRIHAGEARLTVLPRPRPVESVTDLVGRAGNDLEARPETRLPTEGSLRLREYQPGDDARRIHWVRSLTARQVVVRLPDELPPETPAVRLVLDTFLPGAARVACTAPSELLDAMVAVWLGVARALVESGARVTLVTAATIDGEVVPLRRRLTAHTRLEALRLGAQARWQDTLRLDRLTSNESSIVVSCRMQPDPVDAGPVRWILVPESVWTCFEDRPKIATPGVLPHPVGTADNRWSRVRRERMRRDHALEEHKRFSAMCENLIKPRQGSFIACDAGPLRVRLEALQ